MLRHGATHLDRTVVDNRLTLMLKLHDVVVHLKWLPKGDPGPATVYGKCSLILADLDFDPEPDVTFLRTGEGQPLGVMSIATSRGLKHVKEQCSVRLQVWIQETSWIASAKTLSRHNRKCKHVVRLQTDILAYGDSHQGQSVAEVLSYYKLYLQDPHPELNDSPYVNPQSLVFPSITEGLLDSTSSELCSDHNLAEAFSKNAPLYDQDFDETNLLQMLDSFLEELPTHDYLTDRAGDNRILTKLYRSVSALFAVNRADYLLQPSTNCRGLYATQRIRMLANGEMSVAIPSPFT